MYSLIKVTFLSCFLIFFTNCNSQNNNTMDNTYDASDTVLINRKPAVAGRFYPGTASELNKDLKSMFAKAEKQQYQNVMAVISPHAGYVFSGGVAASGFNQIDKEKQYKTIFIIGSSHKVAFTGASIYSVGNYETPLGTVKVNRELAKELIDEYDFLNYYEQAHQLEHSLEVQLPFLQYILKKDFQIVPIIIGSQDKGMSKKIAEALKPYFTKDNLFVISTDFSHYPEYNDACKADKATAEAICMNDPDELLTTIDENARSGITDLATSCCGWTSVLTLMYITKGMDVDYKLVQYKNSGDSPYGDHDRVVGYNAIVVVPTKIVEGVLKQADEVADSTTYSLTDEEKKQLLKLARNTIKEYVINGKTPKLNPNDYSKNLKEHCGAFVTLHKDGNLRGCIGRFEPDIPLYEVVQEMAISAATRDYRFSAVKKDEIKDLELEISVLTPMKKIDSIDEIELGKHGIYIKKGGMGGTFLPQVATETGWSKEEFLGHCSRDKARLGWDGWKDADIYIYEALVFSEPDFENK